jgi:hypothetical protein
MRDVERAGYTRLPNAKAPTCKRYARVYHIGSSGMPLAVQLGAASSGNDTSHWPSLAVTYSVRLVIIVLACLFSSLKYPQGNRMRLPYNRQSIEQATLMPGLRNESEQSVAQYLMMMMMIGITTRLSPTRHLADVTPTTVPLPH